MNSAAVENIVNAASIYVDNCNLMGLVLGISGGIDSCVVAALARKVCDRTGARLIGRSLPIETNADDEIKRARLTGETFCEDFEEVDLWKPYREAVMATVANENEGDALSPLRCGNFKARVRMMHLYDLAQKFKGMVLSTDNLTEYLLGFWTLHGDVGDYGMIQNLWKTEVYELAEVLAETADRDDQREALRTTIAATPTDGLGITSCDLDQILPGWETKLNLKGDERRWPTSRVGYAHVDRVLKRIAEEGLTRIDQTDGPIRDRHIASAFKRKLPISITREEIFE